MTPTKSQKDWLEANPEYVQTENGVAYRKIGAVSPDGRFMKIKMRHPIIFQREIDWMGVGVSNAERAREAAMQELADQAQELDMGYSTVPNGERGGEA